MQPDPDLFAGGSDDPSGARWITERPREPSIVDVCRASYDDSMPTVLRSGPYRLFFYAGDVVEPPHVHVERDRAEAEFWLEPVRYIRSHGFSANELNRIERIINEHQQELIEAWHDFFDS